MNEATSLNDKIDRLAKQKADGHLRSMNTAIELAAKSALASGPGSVFFAEAFRALLRRWATINETRPNNDPPLPYSKEMVDYYRGKILDEVLEKLPLVKELAAMKDDNAT